MSTQQKLFDEVLLDIRRKRAKRQGLVYFLHDLMVGDLQNRLEDHKTKFRNVEIIGPLSDYWKKKIKKEKWSTQEDHKLLDISPNSKDLIVSALYIHSINDPISRFVQMREGLKKNGVLIAYAFGENSLCELRQAFSYAETRVNSGVSPRINPMIDTATLGALIRRSGFKHCVSDKLQFSFDYTNLKRLFKDLRGMGETNCMLGRSRKFLTKKLLNAVLDYYQQHFRICNESDRVKATVDVICVTAWNSAPSIKNK